MCRTDTWKIPSSSAWDSCPAASMLPLSAVMPGMNPSTPTSRKATPTRAAAAWTGVPVAVDRDRRRMSSLMAAPYPLTPVARIAPTPEWGPARVAQVTA